MMSISPRTSSGKMNVFCHMCIMLLSLQQVQCDNAPVSREGLREEHLLPVRLSRSALDGAFEGSGDEDSVQIRPLGNGVMERMMLKPDEEAEEEENKIVNQSESILKSDENLPPSPEDLRSVETMENIDEGSGFDDATPRTAAIVATNAEKEVDIGQNATETTTEKEEETSTVEAEEKNSSESSGDVEISTVKEEEITSVTPKTVAVTDIALDTTTVQEEELTALPDTTTVREVNLLPTNENKEETTVVPETVTPTEIPKETTPMDLKEATTTLLPDEDVTDTKLEERTEAQTTTITTDERLETTTTEEVAVTPVLIVEENSGAVETKKEPELTPVTELIEVKHVKPVFAGEIPETTKALEEEEEEVKTEETTTVIPAVTVFDNGTLLENENLTAETDTLLMKIKSRLLDTNETVLNSSKDPSRLGTYIVVSLILLSFLSLIGFVLMKRRVQKRRKKSNMDQEALDTEKALLSLSEYKDHPDGVDEGKIKNNEITPIVIKSNSQINKFEKNTNFSSPKNLNTKANEKNIEKDNVLKKTSDNLTQVIIEDPTKDVEEDKVPTNAEKLIVRTHLDQDSIPKKPVIVNRTSLGCLPVTQD